MMSATLYMVDNYLLARVSRKRCLKNTNYDVSGDFSSVDDCSSALENNNVDMVIVDLDLLSTSMYEAIRTLKTANPKTKIIVTSSFIIDKITLSMLANWINAYVFKEKKGANFKNILEIVKKGKLYLDFEVANSVFKGSFEIKNQDRCKTIEKKELEDSLTQREMEVLKLMIDGKTNSQIAREIIISTNTAKAHVGSILTKLSVTDRVQAAVKAVRANIF